MVWENAFESAATNCGRSTTTGLSQNRKAISMLRSTTASSNTESMASIAFWKCIDSNWKSRLHLRNEIKDSVSDFGTLLCNRDRLFRGEREHGDVETEYEKIKARAWREPEQHGGLFINALPNKRINRRHRR